MLNKVYALNNHVRLITRFYGIVHDEMIRYRIIVGLRDSNLPKRLQTYPKLNLNKAITIARRTEAVRELQAVVRGEIDNTYIRIEEVEHSSQIERLH